MKTGIVARSIESYRPIHYHVLHIEHVDDVASSQALPDPLKIRRGRAWKILITCLTCLDMVGRGLDHTLAACGITFSSALTESSLL